MSVDKAGLHPVDARKASLKVCFAEHLTKLVGLNLGNDGIINACARVRDDEALTTPRGVVSVKFAAYVFGSWYISKRSPLRAITMTP